MSGDPTLNVDAVFISMRDADVLRASPLLSMPAPNALPGALWDDNQEGFLSWSGGLIWLLGVCTCAYASHKSFDDVMKKRRLPTHQPATVEATDDEDRVKSIKRDFILIYKSLQYPGFYCVLYSTVGKTGVLYILHTAYTALAGYTGHEPTA